MRLGTSLRIKKAACVLAAVVVALAVPLDAAAGESGRAELKVDADMLGSSAADAELIARLPRGTKVTVRDFKDDYYEVEYNKQSGYVAQSAVKLLYESVKIDAKGVVNAEEVNLRSKPDIGAAIITKLKKGMAVEISEKCATWFKVEAGRQQGYVQVDYIDLQEVERSDYYAELKMGMSGTAVIRLQDVLKTQGYYSGKCSGSFGAATREAVKKFQEAGGLNPNGIATAQTQTLLYD